MASDVVGAYFWTVELMNPGLNWQGHALMVSYGMRSVESHSSIRQRLDAFPPSPDRVWAVNIVDTFLRTNIGTNPTILMGLLALKKVVEDNGSWQSAVFPQSH